MDRKISLILSAFVFNLSLPVYATTFIAPDRAALVDTGYDYCVQTNRHDCSNNKNLLFRGNVPLDYKHDYQFDADVFRQKIFNYLQSFQQAYQTNAPLPKTLEELKQYRIVIINLLYDGTQFGDEFEYQLLTNEFKYTGFSSELTVPEQHKMYNLNTAFNPKTFAFEWWPMTMLGLDNHDGIPGAINWPNHVTVPVPRTTQNYKPMDLPYLITGIPYADDVEKEALSLSSLLATQPTDQHPLLIFMHCYAGVDRTGAVNLSYLMTYGGYPNIDPNNHQEKTLLTRNPPLSLELALAADVKENYPRPNDLALWAAKSYCQNLGVPASFCTGVIGDLST